MTRNINMLYLLLSNTQNTLLVRLLDTYMMPEHKEHLNMCVCCTRLLFLGFHETMTANINDR